LRASAETDLVARFPIHVVTAWLENTPNIALKHYLRITPADVERAVTEPWKDEPGLDFGTVPGTGRENSELNANRVQANTTNGPLNGGTESGTPVAHNPAQKAPTQGGEIEENESQYVTNCDVTQ